MKTLQLKRSKWMIFKIQGLLNGILPSVMQTINLSLKYGSQWRIPMYQN